MSKLFDVTIEDNAGYVWEGRYRGDTLEINDVITIRLHTKSPRYAWGTVIMFQEVL